MAREHLTNVICVRDGAGNLRLAPAAPHDVELFQKIGVGKEALIRLRKVRSPKQHRLFFTLLNITVENLEGWTVDSLRDAVSLTLGYYTVSMNLRTGEVAKVPKSISYASMDQISFGTFFNAAVDELAAFLGCTPDELHAEVARRNQDCRTMLDKMRQQNPMIGHNSRGAAA